MKVLQKAVMTLTLRKRHCKLLSVFLLAVVLLTSIPVVPVSATGGSPFPFDYPSSDTFYPTDFVIRLFNCGDAYYLRVRTDTGLKIAYWKFLEQYTIPVTPDPFSKYTFYDDVGNVVDNPFIGTRDNNLLLFRSVDEDLTGSTPYGIVQASNANLYAYDEGVALYEGEQYIYFYKNYSSLAATPTPTPTPEPEIDEKFPTFTNAYAVNYSGTEIRYESLFLLCNRYYDEANTRYEYQYFIVPKRVSRGVDWQWKVDITPYYDSYEFIDNIFTAYFTNINPDHNYDIRYGGSFFTSSNYKTINDVYDLHGYSSTAGSTMTETATRKYEFSVSEPSMNYEATAVYLINTDGSTTRLDGDVPSATPTPIPSPTLMPQPSIEPEPTVEPPDTGDDNNWTGLFGWFKKLINSILSIPMKIINGLLSVLKYIFIPDIGKIKTLYADLNDKVGIQKPAKFDFDPAALTRPKNVYFDFHSIPINGQESETTRVTIIDFKQVDDWLDTSAGHMIIKITKACFSLLLWAYMIYVFTKHIGSINYTDASRLEAVYARSNEFKGEETDV